jgi:geranylgeranyl pyrophosphate synthase
MTALIERKFSGPGDVDEALRFIHASGSLVRTRDIAIAQAELAIEAIEKLEPSPESEALVALAARVVDRSH